MARVSKGGHARELPCHAADKKWLWAKAVEHAHVRDVVRVITLRYRHQRPTRPARRVGQKGGGALGLHKARPVHAARLSVHGNARQEGVVVVPLDTVVASVCGRSNGGAHPLVPRVPGVDMGVERVVLGLVRGVVRIDEGFDALAMNTGVQRCIRLVAFALVAIAKTGLGVAFGVVGVGRGRGLVVIVTLAMFLK